MSLNPVTPLGRGAVLDVTLSLDTDIYADNDVLAAPQEITDAFPEARARMLVQSVVLLDEDDQAQAIDLVFMNADGSLGAENAAVGPTDAVARTIIGVVPIVAADYSDLGNSQIATVNNIGLYLKASATSSSLWLGAIVRSGTPTYSASGIRIKLGVLWE